MGFRSTLTSEHYAINWPTWFKEKYKNFVHKGSSVLYSTIELKTYGFMDLGNDVQKALIEVGYFKDSPDMDFCFIWLHECGGITKIQITKDKILSAEPTGWNVSEEEYDPTYKHNYCYGCSKLQALNEKGGE